MCHIFTVIIYGRWTDGRYGCTVVTHICFLQSWGKRKKARKQYYGELTKKVGGETKKKLTGGKRKKRREKK